MQRREKNQKLEKCGWVHTAIPKRLGSVGLGLFGSGLENWFEVPPPPAGVGLLFVLGDTGDSSTGTSRRGSCIGVSSGTTGVGNGIGWRLGIGPTALGDTGGDIGDPPPAKFGERSWWEPSWLWFGFWFKFWFFWPLGVRSRRGAWWEVGDARSTGERSTVNGAIGGRSPRSSEDRSTVRGEGRSVWDRVNPGFVGRLPVRGWPGVPFWK